jgi:DNA invertase Pin-like site-specific DNA recombinase
MKVIVLYRLSDKRKLSYAQGSKQEYNLSAKIENQQGVMQKVIDIYNLKLVHEPFVEVHTGREGADKRPVLREILEMADRKEFEALLVWAPDRITREGGWNLIGYLKRMSANNIFVYTYLHNWLDIRTPQNEILVYFYGQMARIESDLNSMRVKRSRQRRIKDAKAKNVQPNLGGKKKVVLNEAEMAEFKKLRFEQGASLDIVFDSLNTMNPAITIKVLRRIEREMNEK